MLGFILGLMIGGFIGICIMAMVNLAKNSDNEMYDYFSKGE